MIQVAYLYATSYKETNIYSMHNKISSLPCNSLAFCDIFLVGGNVLLFFQKMGRVVKKMIKVRTKNSDESRNESILSKRKLDYRYSGFSSSASRPPIASPDLEENIGVKKDEKPKR